VPPKRSSRIGIVNDILPVLRLMRISLEIPWILSLSRLGPGNACIVVASSQIRLDPPNCGRIFRVQIASPIAPDIFTMYSWLAVETFQLFHKVTDHRKDCGSVIRRDRHLGHCVGFCPNSNFANMDIEISIPGRTDRDQFCLGSAIIRSRDAFRRRY